MFDSYTDKELKDFIEQCDYEIERGNSSFGVPDSTYEDAKREATKRGILLSSPDYTVDEDNIFMGSIPKIRSINEVNVNLNEVDEDWVMSPKYDGVSALATYIVIQNELVLSTARTRGKVKNGVTTCSDITAKMKMVQPTLYIDTLALNKIEKVIVRGELVLRGDYMTENKATIKAPAAAATGFINRKDITNGEFANAMTFKPYEIVKIVSKTGQEFTPTQKHAYEILGTVHTDCIKYRNITIDVLAKQINDFKVKVLEPIDGVVFSPAKWMYPFNKDNRSTLNYGKYAYKHTTEFSSTVSGVTPLIDSSGKISYILEFVSVVINGQNRKSAKMSFDQLRKFNSELGIGSIVTIKLNSNIYPYILSIIKTPKVKELCFGDLTKLKCPFCNSDTSISVGNSYTLSCNNLNCRGKLAYRMALLLSDGLHLAGVSADTLLNTSDVKMTLNDVMNKFSTKLKFKIKKSYVKLSNVTNIFEYATALDILLGLNVCTKGEATNLLIKVGLNPNSLVSANPNLVFSAMLELRKNVKIDLFDSVAIDLFNSFYTIFIAPSMRK